MTTYRSATEFAERFSPLPIPGARRGEPQFQVDAYLRDRGARFVQSMRPERFLALSLSTDLHRVDPSRITTPTTVVAATGDTIVPCEQLTALSARLAGPSTLVELPSRVGHDAFLVETAKVSTILSAALS
jgi:homoserine O-acetyltransferase